MPTLPENTPLTIPIKGFARFSRLSRQRFPLISRSANITINTPIPRRNITSSRIMRSLVPKGRPIITPESNSQMCLIEKARQQDAITLRLSIMENISRTGTTVLGETKIVSNGNARIENPKPDSPCNNAEAAIIIDPQRIRLFICLRAFHIRINSFFKFFFFEVCQLNTLFFIFCITIDICVIFFIWKEHDIVF